MSALFSFYCCYLVRFCKKCVTWEARLMMHTISKTWSKMWNCFPKINKINMLLIQCFKQMTPSWNHSLVCLCIVSLWLSEIYGLFYLKVRVCGYNTNTLGLQEITWLPVVGVFPIRLVGLNSSCHRHAQLWSLLGVCLNSRNAVQTDLAFFKGWPCL